MEAIKQFCYEYGFWILLAACALILLLVIILLAVSSKKAALKKQNKLLSDNNARYSREINDLRYQNDRMLAAKTQSENERADREETAAPPRAEKPQTEDFDNRLHATIEEEDEYEVSAAFDETSDKPSAAAYTLKYDRAKTSWVIMKSGQERPVRRVQTKDEALKIARELAKKTGAGLYVHKKDGKFQKV